MSDTSLWVGKEGIRSARQVNLYDFLMSEHPNDIIQEGDSIRLAGNHSISVKAGYSGYQDFANGETGNSIELLTRHLGYAFQEAVTALCEFAGLDPTAQPTTISLAHLGEAPAPALLATPATAPNIANTGAKTGQIQTKAQPRAFQPPNAFNGPYSALFAYLNKIRGIPNHVIQRLVNMGVLYQEGESGHNNIVFINPERTFYEVRGTYSDIPFHQVQFSDPDAFWWFKPRDLNDSPICAYVCESAIDAISLYLLRSMDQANYADRSLFCSIGGVANQHRIDVIKAGMAAGGCKTIIAVDRDDAGDLCRQRNPDCGGMLPGLKDWNQDLTEYVKTSCNGIPPEWIGRLPVR